MATTSRPTRAARGFTAFWSLLWVAALVGQAANADAEPAVAAAESVAEPVAEVHAESTATPPTAESVETEVESPEREESLQDGQPTDEELRRIEDALGVDTEYEDDASAPGTAAEYGSEPAPRQFAASFANALNPELALILDVAVSYFSDDPGTLGAHDPQRTGFTFQQLEMALGAAVDPYFRLDANLVFSQFGVEVEEAYATTLGVPGGLQFRVGQFLTRFGRQNSTHPHSWHFVDQPLVLGKFFGGEGNRGLGGETSWLIPLPWYMELVASVNEAEGDCCMRSYFGADRPRLEGFGDFAYTIALKQFFPFGASWGLKWGLTAQFGPTSTGTRNRAEIYGTDLYLRYKPTDGTRSAAVTLAAEFMHRRRQVPGDVLTDTGGYAQIVWRVTKRWETGARYEFVTGIEDDPLDPEWSEFRDRTSVQGTLYPSHFSRIRLQGGLDRRTWQADSLGWSTTLNLEFLIGAHGAHDY